MVHLIQSVFLAATTYAMLIFFEFNFLGTLTLVLISMLLGFLFWLFGRSLIRWITEIFDWAW